MYPRFESAVWSSMHRAVGMGRKADAHHQLTSTAGYMHFESNTQETKHYSLESSHSQCASTFVLGLQGKTVMPYSGTVAFHWGVPSSTTT